VWIVETTDLFAEWLKEQDRAMQLDVLAALNLLKQEGPHLGRPHVDTLYGSKIPNMKELRVQSNGWPVGGSLCLTPCVKRLSCVQVIKKAQMKSASTRP
jgi:hypothetical protein